MSAKRSSPFLERGEPFEDSFRLRPIQRDHGAMVPGSLACKRSNYLCIRIEVEVDARLFGPIGLLRPASQKLRIFSELRNYSELMVRSTACPERKK